MRDVLLAGFQKKERFFGRISLKAPVCFSLYRKSSETFTYVLVSVGVTLFLAYFFYRSIWAVLPLSGIGVMYYRRLIRNAIRRNRQEVAVQFRDCILSVTASLQAGYSVENAMLESIHDMEIIHGRDSVIYRELILIRRGMRINISLEELLTEFGRRSECEEIIQFAEVFSIAKRSSGSLTNIIKNSAELISKKISIRQEITVLVSGKQMELTIMKGMPFVILLYVESANRGYFDCLYHNAGGIAVMTGCLIAYLVAYGCGERIMSNTMRYLA